MKSNILFALIMAFVFASCKKDSIDNENTINIVASITSQSRTPQLGNDGSGSFEKGDIMSLFVKEDDSNIIPLCYEYGSETVTWGDLELVKAVSQVDIAACYPQQENLKNATFEFNILTASYKDLLLAPAKRVTVGTSEPFMLVFNHAMHRFDISFTPGDGYTKESIESLSVTLRAKTTCVVDGMKGVIKEIKNDEGEFKATGASVSFYLVPQTISGITLNISVDGENKQITLEELLNQLGSPQDELISGKRISLDLKINRSGITVEGGSIGGWENQATVDGEVEIG